MKATTTAVTNLINAARSSPDAPLAFAECFQFTSTIGTVYAWTNVDYPVAYNGLTFLATGPLVNGLKYKGSVGLEVDKQQLTIAARPTDTINGAPFLIALRDGAFDGAAIIRYRVFLTAPGGTVVGGVIMFQGRISTVDNVGRTQATVTVASDLVVLDYRHAAEPLFADVRPHALRFGLRRHSRNLRRERHGGRRLDRDINRFHRRYRPRNARLAGVLLGGERQRPHDDHALRGPASATRSCIRCRSPQVSATPSPLMPAAITHRATCQNRFNNLANFRGFPYVPPPQMAY